VDGIRHGTVLHRAGQQPDFKQPAAHVLLLIPPALHTFLQRQEFQMGHTLIINSWGRFADSTRAA